MAGALRDDFGLTFLPVTPAKWLVSLSPPPLALLLLPDDVPLTLSWAEASASSPNDSDLEVGQGLSLPSRLLLRAMDLKYSIGRKWLLLLVRFLAFELHVESGVAGVAGVRGV